MEAVLDRGSSVYGRATKPSSKRRSLGFCLAGGFLVAGVVAVLLTWGALGFFRGIDRLARAPIPGAVGVRAQRADEIVVYYEGSEAPAFNELALRVSGPDGVAVTARPYGADLRYDHDDEVGTAVASFTAPAAGRYLISAAAAESGARLAVGGDLGTEMLLTDAAGVGIGFSALAAIAIVVAVVLRRSKSRSSRPRRPDCDLAEGFRRATPPLPLAG